MSNILEMKGKEMGEVRFDIEAVIVIPGDTNSVAILEEALTQGFEPFAVTPHIIVPKQSGIATVGEAQKPLMADKVWLKKRVFLEKHK